MIMARPKKQFTDEETIETEMSFWRAYCETALTICEFNDALRLLHVPINDKRQAMKELKALRLG